MVGPVITPPNLGSQFTFAFIFASVFLQKFLFVLGKIRLPHFRFNLGDVCSTYIQIYYVNLVQEVLLYMSKFRLRILHSSELKLGAKTVSK